MSKRTSLHVSSALLIVGLALYPCLAESDSPAAMQKKIAKFSANGTLDETAAKLADAGGLKIVIDWPTLKATGVDQKANIAFSASSATVEQLLEMALSRAAAKDCPLAWYAQGQTIHVTSQSKVLYSHGRPEPAAAARSERKPAASREINFDGTALSDVMTYVRELADVNMVVNWKSLEACGITKESQVTLQAKDLSFARLLDLVLDQVNSGKDRLSRAYWVVNDGVVTIASGETLNDELTSKVVDIADLLITVPDFKGPTLDMSGGHPGVNGAPGGDGQNPFNDVNKVETTTTDDDRSNRAKIRENLIAAVKNSIGEDMWKPDGKGSITIIGNKMVISQTLLGFKLMEMSGKK